MIGYKHFYTGDNFNTASSDKNWIYERGEYFGSKYESLVGKVFKVLSYEKYYARNGEEKFKIKLANSETGLLVYDYSAKFEWDFPFEVIGGLEVKNDFFCDKVDSSFDKFTGEIKYTGDCRNEGMSLLKHVNNTSKEIYLSLVVSANTLVLNEKGITILLTNNKRIVKPNAKVDVSVSSSTQSNYLYQGFILLNAQDIELLKNERITDFRLYIFDRAIKDGTKIQEFAKCFSN